jgi:hypothetical protein
MVSSTSIGFMVQPSGRRACFGNFATEYDG